MSINLNSIWRRGDYLGISAPIDELILINVAGPASVVLPTVSISETGLSFYIKDISGNATVNPITITALGGALVDGTAFAILNRGYSHVQVAYDGTNWDIIA